MVFALQFLLKQTGSTMHVRRLPTPKLFTMPCTYNMLHACATAHIQWFAILARKVESKVMSQKRRCTTRLPTWHTYIYIYKWNTHVPTVLFLVCKTRTTMQWLLLTTRCQRCCVAPLHAWHAHRHGNVNHSRYPCKLDCFPRFKLEPK